MSGRRIHLMGIGGVGMAGLAVLLKSDGNEVSGCDCAASPRTAWLETLGVAVSIEHDSAHVSGVDEVIVTPAVSKDNPELLSAQRSCRIRYRGEVLAEIVSRRESIAVCGSHGKTTTSTWIAKLLLALGEDVSWCIGGETGGFPVARAGRGVLVVEADESDGTLALYHPTTLVVNKLEYDHPDHFKTVESYFACFDRARAQAKDVVESESLAPLSGPEGLAVLETLPIHNRKNARAAIEVALRRGHSLEKIAAALPEIVATLPDRRFQKICEGVYTDYAHHPTEMSCAVQMARQICSGTLRVLFQPHRYSRTKALLADFPAAFEGADEVVLCPTYAAFEKPVEGGDIADLYKACREQGAVNSEQACPCRFLLAQSCAEAWEHARRSMAPGDVTLLLGAGNIINLVPQVLADLGGTGEPRSPRKILIGAGSNTWRSDLNLAVEYVKTSGPAGAPGTTLVAAHPTLCPWMAGIPGTIGGWIKMNAGAFGHSISEVLDAVKVDGKWIAAADCGFGYRTSGIDGEIQDYRLLPVPPEPRPKADAAVRPCVLARGADKPSDYLARRKKFPAGTYGSFFKNPPGDFAGRLLEEVGAKELSVGGASVWSEHANVIVRGAGATNSDVLALARLMRNRVFFRLGVTLECEVRGIAEN